MNAMGREFNLRCARVAALVSCLVWTPTVKPQDQPASPPGQSRESPKAPAKAPDNPPADGSAKPAPAAQRNPYDDTPAFVPPGAAKSVEIAHYYYVKKEYRAALSRYMEAVSTHPDYAPGYLGMAKSEEKLGFKKQALESYRKYLDELPSDKDAQNAKDVHKAIRRLESQLGVAAADSAAKR